MAVASGAMLAHSQGLVNMQENALGFVQTNATSLSGNTGNVHGLGAYDFELLDMTSASWASLTAGQQAGAANLFANPSDISLWTDSTINGNSDNSAGEVSGGSSVAASGWGLPTGAGYSSGSVDEYVIVGWSSNEGTTWTAVSAELQNHNWAVSSSAGGPFGFFGETAAAFNVAGGGPNNLTAVAIWGGSTQTGIAGSGFSTTTGTLVLTPIVVPEPTTLALAGLGGISMLFLRRRKA